MIFYDVQLATGVSRGNTGCYSKYSIFCCSIEGIPSQAKATDKCQAQPIQLAPPASLIKFSSNTPQAHPHPTIPDALQQIPRMFSHPKIPAAQQQSTAPNRKS